MLLRVTNKQIESIVELIRPAETRRETRRRSKVVLLQEEGGDRSRVRVAGRLLF